MFHKTALLACTSILAVLVGFEAAANAQETSTPKYEVGVNYSWLHVTRPIMIISGPETAARDISSTT
jgi:hypothetical protein